MNNRDKNVVKFNRDIKINAATVIIAAVLLYVMVFVIIAANKEPITTYKVNKTDVNNNISLTGLIVRDEELLTTSKSGYICYYVRDGEKVMKNASVCTVDETGQLYSQVTDSESYDGLLTEEDYKDIRSLISLYKLGYSDDEFYSAYGFYNNANNKVLELTNEILMQQASSTDASTSLTAITTPCSGIVTYYIDGYEDYDINNISAEDFDTSDYEKQTLKSGDVVSAQSSIVKVVPSETWNIVAPVSSENIAAISESDHVSIRINNSENEIWMPYEIINAADGSYINITLDKYMSTYLSERFVSVEIVRDEDTGLKVPLTAVVDKEVYKIPKDYFTGGSDQNYAVMLNLRVMGEDGTLTLSQTEPSQLDSDDDYIYVDPSSLNDTDVLYNIKTNETLAVSLLEKDIVKGVYICNRGIAEFNTIDIIKTVDDFVLVESTGNIKIYDNIVLDSSAVVENQIIY